MELVNESQRQMGPKERECPECRSRFPADPRYVQWCDKCGWNLQPNPSLQFANIFDFLYSILGEKLSRDVFDEMVKSRSLAPSWTLSRVSALLFSGFIHGFALILASSGVWLIVGPGPTFFTVVGGLGLLGLAWTARPRFGRMPTGIVRKDKFPALYRIVDRVARALGAKTTDAIVINSEFSAAHEQVGLGKRRILYLGLPLFSILNNEEKVALIARELAHCANGDPNKGLFIGSAAATLAEWYNVLEPEGIWPHEDRPGAGRTVAQAQFYAGIPEAIANLLMHGVACICYGAAFILAHLMYRASQRAEYLADLLAAEACGTDAVLGMLEKLHFVDTHILAVQSAASASGDPCPDYFEDLKKRVAETPPRELERIRRIELLEGFRLDATHPPTPYRVEFLKVRQVDRGKATLTQEDFEELHQELTRIQPAIQKKLIDQHTAALYCR
ncbi:MAG: M48 family metalloprotease [Armatimonadetes bacterium]|nr:M48 family metalloprotease [Armatimonadota bacterium]